MTSELLALLNEADAKCRENIAKIKNSTYFPEREQLSEIRMLIQQAITKLMLID